MSKLKCMGSHQTCAGASCRSLYSQSASFRSLSYVCVSYSPKRIWVYMSAPSLISHLSHGHGWHAPPLFCWSSPCRRPPPSLLVTHSHRPCTRHPTNATARDWDHAHAQGGQQLPHPCGGARHGAQLHLATSTTTTSASTSTASDPLPP